jgi:hypothetical protein
MKKLAFTKHGISKNLGFNIKFNQNYRSIYHSYARVFIASSIGKVIKITPVGQYHSVPAPW